MESVISNLRLAIDVLLAGKLLQKLVLILAMFASIIAFVQDQTYINNRMQEDYKYSRYTEHELYAEDIIQLALGLKGTEYKLHVNGTPVDLTVTRAEIENYLTGVLAYNKRYDCVKAQTPGSGTNKRRLYTFYVTEVTSVPVGP